MLMIFLVIGGASKVLKILDVRILAKDPQKCVVWKAEKAHADTIRDVAWSPLVSHWIASAGIHTSVVHLTFYH
jgi:hypothetical protein